MFPDNAFKYASLVASKHLPELFAGRQGRGARCGTEPGHPRQSSQDLAHSSDDVIDHAEAVALVRAGALWSTFGLRRSSSGARRRSRERAAPALGALGAPGLPNVTTARS